MRPLLDDPTGITDAVWRGLADLGTTGLLVPQEYGGAGMTMVEAGIVAEELGAALHPGPWLSTAVAAPRALTRFGAECPRRRSRKASHRDRRRHHHRHRRPARRRQGRGGHAGRRTLTLRGEFSRARRRRGRRRAGARRGSQGNRAQGFSRCRPTSPGVSVTPEPGIDQTRKQFRVALDDAPAQRLATASSDAVAAVVDDVLIATAADALGAARAVLSLAVEYAKVRKQFGQAIGSFQAIQHLCVDMYETVELARSGVIHALWAADAADSKPDERHLAALRAKAFAGRLATVGDTAIQVFGGIGYTWEHDAHLYLKRLLSWSALLGGPDRYLTELGARLANSEHKRRRQ